MDPQDKKRIQRAWKKLIDEIANVDGVVDGLLAEEVLTKQLREKIMAEKTSSDKLRSLLDILQRRGPSAFNKFYDVLVDTAEDVAADILCPERAEERKRRAAEASFQPVELPLGRQEVQGGQEQIEDDKDELPERWPDPEAHEPFRVDVVQVPETSREMRANYDKALRRGTSSAIYPMHRPVRGKFLLVNNRDFSQARDNKMKLSDREGTDFDQQSLDTLFRQLNFDVVIRVNRTAAQMLEDIQEQALVDHTTFDCFACAVLTHGKKGSLYGIDGETLEIDKFKDAVDGNNCLTLVGKPKLFFLQACQGENIDLGAGLSSGSGEAGPDPNKVEDPVKEMEITLRNLTIEKPDAETDAETESSVPSKADIFVAMATVEDYVSWRLTNWGTFFTQALVYVFSRYAHKYELNKLLRMVNTLVSRAETRKKKAKQISVFKSSLTADFYFFPGLQSTILESHSEPDLEKAKAGKTLVTQASQPDGPIIVV